MIMTSHRFSLALLLSLAFGLSFSAVAEDASKSITNPADALAGIPRDVLKDLRPGSKTQSDACTKATAITRKNVEGKTAIFKMTLKSVDKFQAREAPDVTRFRLVGVVTKVRESGVMFDVHLMAVPDVTEEAKIAKLTAGSKITVTGKIGNAEVLGHQYSELHIDIKDVKVN